MKWEQQRLISGGGTSICFDFTRGIAAMYVMVFHFRQQLFVGLSTLVHPSVLTKGFYLMTSIGYQFVMAFFVLSGFLISTTVCKQIQSGHWSWRLYLTSRLVRLWVVLLPGLLLTFAWDKLAIVRTGNLAFYQATLNWRSFFGSLFFLQGIHASTFGQNIPLWSLSYEFWYYLLFPCVVLTVMSRRFRTRVLYGVLVVGLSVFVGKTILAYFAVWLLGYAVSICPAVTIYGKWRRVLTVTVVMTMTVIVMVAGKLVQYHAADSGNMLQSFPTSFSTGVAFAGLFYVLLICFNQPLRTGPRWGSSVSVGLSRMSYTLYLTHCPVILALRVMIGYETWRPDAGHFVLGIAVCIGILAYAWAIACLTEGHTSKIRSWILRLGAKKKNGNTVAGGSFG